jgi:prepilin-type N-terminal cleavage/methylation domain-containing protein/prepilin-type processing-associated H-X9-DG protein
MIRELFERTRSRDAFTLVELLVVLGVMAVLVGALLPGMGRAREQAKAAACRSNLRQVVLANAMYAQDSSGVYAPGAADFVGNLQRWHGTRTTAEGPFDSTHGPLVDYLGPDRAVRACPAFVSDAKGFEAGNGGYGYNNAYIGVQTIVDATSRTQVVSDLAGARVHQVKRPADTLMFADSAFVDGRLIEYSFAEPRFFPEFGTRADPSIHFRHVRTSNIAWCDGHVTRERRTFTWSSGLYEGDPGRFDIGWFGRSDDNTFFDLK